MKHPNPLDGLFSHEVARIRRANIGGKVGVGFAGGGSSTGLKAAGLKINFAMKHDAAAIAMHAANCPAHPNAGGERAEWDRLQAAYNTAKLEKDL